MTRRPLTPACLLDRKRCLWWVRTSPCLIRRTQRPPPCIWKLKWLRLGVSARHPNRVQSKPSRNGRGQRHKTLGREANTSMGPGESGLGGHAGGWARFLDNLTQSASTPWVFREPKNICLLFQVGIHCSLPMTALPEPRSFTIQKQRGHKLLTLKQIWTNRMLFINLK